LDDVGNRIFELLDATAMEQQQFAELVGVSDGTASNWRRGKSASYTKYLPQIAEALGTTSEYLLTGQGPKVPASVSELDTISPADQRLLDAYRQADERSRAIVRLALNLDDITE